MSTLRRSLPAKLWRALSRALAALVDADRRDAFKRELFYRLAAKFTPAIVVRSEGRRYLMSTADHGSGMTLFMGEDSERETLEKVFATLAEGGAPIRTGGTLIDVGAHVGTASVTALQAFEFGRAVCFEPLPENRELLEVNLAYNGLGARSEVHGVALSDEEGTAVFEVAPMNPSDARIRVADPGGEALDERAWQTVEVPKATLDSFVERGDIDPGSVTLLWIDAQGHEAQILAGAGSLLTRGIPTVAEFWPYGLRRAGGMEALVETVSGSYSRFLDLGVADAAPRPAGEIAGLAGAYPGVTHTDLLLIP